MNGILSLNRIISLCEFVFVFCGGEGCWILFPDDVTFLYGAHRTSVMFKMERVDNQQQKQVYLITYSRANLTAFPSRESFATAIVRAFETKTTAKVLHWVVCIERRSDHFTDDSSFHHHMAVKLPKKTRWVNVRSYLDEEFHIQVKFSAFHSTYYSAYRYTVKEDNEAIFSEKHSDLSEAREPRTEKATSTRKRKGKQTKSKAGKKKERKRLSVYDVTQLIQSRKITSRLELVALAVQQNRAGKSNLSEFIANRGQRAVEDALQLAKEFREAEAQLARGKKRRLCWRMQRAVVTVRDNLN